MWAIIQGMKIGRVSSVHIGHSADGLSTDIDYSVVGTGAKTAASSVSIGHQSQASGNSGSLI